ELRKRTPVDVFRFNDIVFVSNSLDPGEPHDQREEEDHQEDEGGLHPPLQSHIGGWSHVRTSNLKHRAERREEERQPITKRLNINGRRGRRKLRPKWDRPNAWLRLRGRVGCRKVDELDLLGLLHPEFGRERVDTKGRF